MRNGYEWLLRSFPWVEYRCRLDLLDEEVDSPAVINARNAMIIHPMIQALISECLNWPGDVLNNHKKAGHLIHKLVFLADIGINNQDQGVQEILDRILLHQDKEGPFQCWMNIPIVFGGDGKDQWNWMLCDAPHLLYVLAKMGMKEDIRIKKAVEYLLKLCQTNGWPCAASETMGKFHGPGKRVDPCPYANLLMIKLLSLFPEWRDGRQIQLGSEALLQCWEKRESFHPFLFYMGTDFCKLKAPLIWFDILHVTSVLSELEWLKEDERLKDMIRLITTKADEEGLFVPESVWTAWKEWDFGQKKAPSAWLTYLVSKVIKNSINP